MFGSAMMRPARSDCSLARTLPSLACQSGAASFAARCVTSATPPRSTHDASDEGKSGASQTIQRASSGAVAVMGCASSV
jgi:hypothetical protein